MRSIARRRFLQNGLELGGALLLGACGGGSDGQPSSPGPSPSPSPSPNGCPDQFAGGQQQGVAAFVGESERPLEQAFNSGLDGRLFTDLSKLGPTNLVTPSEAFYIRTRSPDLLVPESPWRISVLGLPGSPVELFRHPRWRKNTVIGLLLGVSGMIGLWGIGFFSPELISTALRGETQAVVDRVRGLGTALQDVGSFFGMVTFTMIAAFLSRRIAFLGALLLSMTVTAFVFTSLHSASDAYWMLPMMGFAQLAVFAGYSIYFPELFPTRLRGTGVGFCYNTVRYLAAPAPILFGYLATVMSFRTAAVLMSSVYLIGTVALIWAPETKGQPLPED